MNFSQMLAWEAHHIATAKTWILFFMHFAFISEGVVQPSRIQAMRMVSLFTAEIKQRFGALGHTDWAGLLQPV